MNSNVKTASRVILAIQAAMLLAVIPVVSNADAADQVRTETVKFADLNVNTPAGAQALYTRIRSAAYRVCYQDSSDPLTQIAAATCAKDAEARAIEKLNLPQLTAFYQMKTGKHTQPLSANR